MHHHNSSCTLFRKDVFPFLSQHLNIEIFYADEIIFLYDSFGQNVKERLPLVIGFPITGFDSSLDLPIVVAAFFFFPKYALKCSDSFFVFCRIFRIFYFPSVRENKEVIDSNVDANGLFRIQHRMGCLIRLINKRKVIPASVLKDQASLRNGFF